MGQITFAPEARSAEGPLAQLAEQLPLKESVPSSTLGRLTFLSNMRLKKKHPLIRVLKRVISRVSMPELFITKTIINQQDTAEE